MVGTIAIVAIVYAIIDCLKKAGTAIPAAYTRIANIDEKTSNSQTSSTEVAINIPQDFPIIAHAQDEFATMERFLSNIARERPIRFGPEQLEILTGNYSTLLGSGGFGLVYKGKFANGVEVAVKVLKVSNKETEEQFKAEVSTIGRTYHINLVRLYGFCFHPEKRALVYEYLENGPLNKFLFPSSQSTRNIELDKLQQIAIGTARGIAYLHKECRQRIIHYDIKPENVLLDKDLNPKVADFGLAKLCSREKSQIEMTHFRGTMGYAAPEMSRPYPVTHKCDVYSFGIVLFEIVGRRRHFDTSDNESARHWLPKWTWDMFKNNELAIMLSLWGITEKDREKAERMLMVALWCVQYSPDDRPQMRTVVKMLEGDMDIHPPPSPFEHLASKPNLSLHNDDAEDSDSSSSWKSNSTRAGVSNSKPVRQTWEIERAS
ncbi:Protein kinase [Quillaja saponaria]|uniref:Protein kinase n=1 Tax=Quillaja saponaria TaxID=32244 RepID=A0AAD7LCV6_QUISA|nr:Protein kinase [Quillaja saponaria]